MCPKKEFSARERYIHIQPKTQETGARKPGTLPGAFEEPQAVGRAAPLRAGSYAARMSALPVRRFRANAAKS